MFSLYPLPFLWLSARGWEGYGRDCQSCRHRLSGSAERRHWSCEHARSYSAAHPAVNGAQLDDWVTSHGQQRHSVVGAFLTWAAHRDWPQACTSPPALTSGPAHHPGRASGLDWLRRAALDDSLDHLDRVVQALMLLYAQPPGRISQLRHPGHHSRPGRRSQVHRSGKCAAPFPVRKDATMPKKFDAATKERARRMIAEQAVELGSVTARLARS